MYFADFIAGSVGGAVGVAVGHPLDTIKVRLQMDMKYTGVWHCIRSTCKTEGVAGFYKGMAMPVSTVSIRSSILFGIYKNCLRGLTNLRGGGLDSTPYKLDIFLSGLVGGVTQVWMMSPVDIVKVRLQCQADPNPGSTSDFKSKYRGPMHCMLTIVREEGVQGLYKGATALVLRDGFSFGTYFLTYTTICGCLTPAGQKQPGWAAILLAGGVSGMCSWFVGTPMDVIKTRLQAKGVGSYRYRGFTHCLTESVCQEGPRVLFTGVGLNCLRAFPVSMAAFCAYELVMSFLHTPP